MLDAACVHRLHSSATKLLSSTPACLHGAAPERGIHHSKSTDHQMGSRCTMGRTVRRTENGNSGIALYNRTSRRLKTTTIHEERTTTAHLTAQWEWPLCQLCSILAKLPHGRTECTYPCSQRPCVPVRA